MIEDSDRMEDDVKDISMPSLMNYLKQAHHYFLDFCLPTIRRKLIEAIDCSTENEVAFLNFEIFDQYAGEVRKHMDYEDMMCLLRRESDGRTRNGRIPYLTVCPQA